MKNKLLGVISLGCSKNRLDTEGMLYALLQNGFEITEELDQADLLIVNTSHVIFSFLFPQSGHQCMFCKALPDTLL